MRKFEYVKRILQTEFEGGKPIFDLPKRSTAKSAGYDFINPTDVILMPHKIAYVKTGVKALMEDDEVLILANRSSNAKKKGIVLINGIGIIDADYYGNEENDGEIAFAFMNITDEPVLIKQGEKLGQGLFQKYYTTENDAVNETRKGGFGSTGK